MKDNNSLEKIGFIAEHIFWSALSWICYKNILFRCIPSHSLSGVKDNLFDSNCHFMHRGNQLSDG